MSSFRPTDEKTEAHGAQVPQLIAMDLGWDPASASGSLRATLLALDPATGLSGAAGARAQGSSWH